MNLQSFYVIGAIAIFTSLALIFNQKQNIDLDTSLYQEAVIVSAELGDSFLNELTREAFDENTVSAEIDTVTSLTMAYSLGAESGEIDVSQYDDIDDYDGYTKTDSLNKLGIFTTTVEVCYIDDANPDTKSSARTFLKRIDIEVTNYYLSNAVKLYYLASY